MSISINTFFFNRIVLCCIIALCVLSGVVTHASTNTFTVQTSLGTDTTPPSVPTGLIATPIATSQINLVWASSTDDFTLSGYQVWRDAVQIATTSAPNYSDTGLIASTTYTYYVTAFDSFLNISASSTLVATTTLSSTTPPSTTNNGSKTGF